MGQFWEKGWLVNLHLKGNKFGSGILINDQGFVLTAFHNVYGNTAGEHIIEKATTSLDGNWHQVIPHISDKNNITVQCSDMSLARKIDLIAIKAEGTSFTRFPLQIATQLPKENDIVILLIYDLNNSKHNYWREEEATVGPVFHKDGFCFFSLHKVNGIDGASGGGVFTTDGKLLGIIKQTRTDTQDYIVSFIGNARLQHLFPQITNTQPSTSSDSLSNAPSNSNQTLNQGINANNNSSVSGVIQAESISGSTFIININNLEELKKILSNEAISKNFIQDSYVKNIPRGWQPLQAEQAGTLHKVIEHLLQAVEQSDGSLPILKFVHTLSTYLKNNNQSLSQELDKWVENTCQILGIDINKITRTSHTPDKDPYLLIKLDPKNKSETITANKTKFTVKAWLFSAKHQKGYNFFEDNNEKTLNEIERSFNNQIYQPALALAGSEKGNLSISFILPIKLIDHNVYSWIIDSGLDKTPLGIYHPVSIRPFERIYAKTGAILYKSKSKWDFFKKIKQFSDHEYIYEQQSLSITDLINKVTLLNSYNAANVIVFKENPSIKVSFLFENFNLEKLYNKLCSDKYICLILIADVEKKQLEITFKKLFNSGIPVILWLNQQTQTTPYAQILDLLSTDKITDLPKLVLEKRREQKEFILLWDDFDTLPPDMIPFSNL